MASFRIDFFPFKDIDVSVLCNLSDDVISCATKTVKYLIKDISGNIRAVFFKPGTRNIHQKKKSDTCFAVVRTTVFPLVLR